MTIARNLFLRLPAPSRVGLGCLAGSILFSALYVAGCSSEHRSCAMLQICAAGGDAGDGGGLSEVVGGGGSAGTSGTPDRGGATSGGEAGAGEGGEAGAAPMSDPCIAAACDTPPGNECLSASTFKTYDSVGSCNKGDCSYISHEIACTCAGSACKTDPCIGMPCSTPAAPKCLDANTLTKYASAGTCNVGSCNYGSIDVPCSFGCANGACKPDPCAGVPCSTQKPPICKDATTVRTYASSGLCSLGSCNYSPTDTACPINKACGGAGACSVCKTATSCGDTCAPCPGESPKCKDLGTTSQCVACMADPDCGMGQCNYVGNTCLPSPSGCNTLVQKGPLVESTAVASALPTGTRGIILAGNYLLSGVKGYSGQLPGDGATLAVTVSGNTVTLNSYDHYWGEQVNGNNSASRWTATFLTSGASLTLQYTCIAPGATPAAVSGFDYSVVNSTTLQLIFPVGNGVGYINTYTKQ